MGNLTVKQIHKSFGGQPVLENISFTAREGEFVSILGPSGSGKSTLFKVIGGLLAPDRGSVYLDGENITGKRGYISYTPSPRRSCPGVPFWTMCSSDRKYRGR